MASTSTTPSDADSARDIQTEVLAMVDRLSRVLLESYVETDEDIGPQIKQFEQVEKQLHLLGQELTRLRDSSSATHEAHKQLTQLASGPSGAASMRTYGERQDGLAKLSQALAAHYDRFVTISVNQLEGLAGVVANKYKTYCSKVIEMRRRKAQLQLLVKQKERSDLRTLERSLIPATPSAGFKADLEGTLMKQSASTKLWWSTYARLDTKQKVLLFTSKQSEPPSAASKAVALSKYVLAHELPEHHIKKAAAFELVPTLPDLPVVILSADGTMMSRRWVCALQETMDAPTVEGVAAAPQVNELTVSPAVSTATSGDAVDMRRDSAGHLAAAAADSTLSPLTPITRKFEQLYDYSSAKIDELDRKFSGTLSEQSQRTEVQLDALVEEKRQAGEVVLHALQEFSSTVSSQMADELLRISEAELEYHTGMVAHLQQLTVALRLRNGAHAADASTPSPAHTASYATPPPPPPPPPSAPEAAVAVATMAVVTNAMVGGDDDSETEAAGTEAAEAEAAETALSPLPASGAVGATIMPPLGSMEGEVDDEIVD